MFMMSVMCKIAFFENKNKNKMAMRSSLQQKGSKRSVQRMKFLESYCDELLKCDHTVTLSSAVTHFFMPKDHDLHIMILQSDGSVEGGEGVTRQHAGSITHPFVTQTYSCVAPFETKDTKNRPFKVAVNEKLDVLIKDPAGWWLVGEEDKCLAWFPAPYLELWEGEDDDAGIQLTGDLYCAVKGYSTKKADEVSVPIGSVVEVLRQSDDGWWLVRYRSCLSPEASHQPDTSPGLILSDRRGSNSSSGSSGSASSRGSETASVAPKVPPRPKAEEILTRCTTMTRKAALASKARLQVEPESSHSR
uniref:NADPH oxidase organizer 1b n=1 Tax=Monopterus albus TaxID=43700 RepID=A0A3Q3JZ04_MONAL